MTESFAGSRERKPNGPDALTEGAPVQARTGNGRHDGQPADQDPYREFTRRMLAMHRVLPYTSGQMPMCSCGTVARICPVVNTAHQLLGHPVPWD